MNAEILKLKKELYYSAERAEEKRSDFFLLKQEKADPELIESVEGSIQFWLEVGTKKAFLLWKEGKLDSEDMEALFKVLGECLGYAWLGIH